MGAIFLPVVALWIILPWLAQSGGRQLSAIHAFAMDTPAYTACRWVAAIVAVLCLFATARCWARMGKDWRMAVAVDESTNLITDGPFRRIRHPIYAFQILLMICTVVVVPTLPMLVVARGAFRIDEREGAQRGTTPAANPTCRVFEVHATDRKVLSTPILTAISKRLSMRFDNLQRWNPIRFRQGHSIPAGGFLGRRALLCAVLTALSPANASPANDAALRAAHKLDAAGIQNLLALDCGRITPADVEGLLVQGPTPRIILLQGSVAVVTMEPFGDFLIAMGYPAQRIRDPRGGQLSQSSFGDSRMWAGTLAWYYESEGTMPMLIGHSQGGMMAIRILHELDGAFHDAIPVWNPIAGEALARTTIRDPRTGEARPVKGLVVGYAAAMATGKLPRIILGQWDMIAKLRRIPDTAEEFTGFTIPWDPIAGTFGDPEPYLAIGTARVRNVTLPVHTNHIRMPDTLSLATNEVTRRWIDTWTPDADRLPPDADGMDTTNIVHAADIWYSVKKHWCLSAQQALTAREVH